MKRRVIITEIANYEVEVGGGPDVALDKFLNGNVNDFPCNIGEREIVESRKPLAVGDSVNVDAHSFPLPVRFRGRGPIIRLTLRWPSYVCAGNGNSLRSDPRLQKILAGPEPRTVY